MKLKVMKVMTESWLTLDNKTPITLKKGENTDGYNFHLRRSHRIPPMQQFMTKLIGKLNKTVTTLSSHSLFPDGMFSYLNVLPQTAFEDLPSPIFLRQTSLN